MLDLGRGASRIEIPTFGREALTLTLKLLEGFIRSQDKSLPGRSVRTSPVGGSVCGCAGLFIPTAPGVARENASAVVVSVSAGLKLTSAPGDSIIVTSRVPTNASEDC